MSERVAYPFIITTVCSLEMRADGSSGLPWKEGTQVWQLIRQLFVPPSYRTRTETPAKYG